MGRFGVVIALVIAVTMALVAVLTVAAIPTNATVDLSANLGAVWFGAGALVLASVFVVVVRMKVRSTRASRSAVGTAAPEAVDVVVVPAA